MTPQDLSPPFIARVKSCKAYIAVTRLQFDYRHLFPQKITYIQGLGFCKYFNFSLNSILFLNIYKFIFVFKISTNVYLKP